MLSDFELAESLWDVAEPGLSDIDRSSMCVALHTAEPLLTIATALRTLVRHRLPLPGNLFDEFQTWLQTSPTLDADDRWCATWLDVHTLASDLERSEHTVPVGGYGAETLCFFILDRAGAADAPRALQAQVLRAWLAIHRPSPLLRADLNANGFGHLLPDRAGTMW